jgi:hypothetical protein
MSRRRARSKSIIASRLKAFPSFSDNFSLSSGLKNGWKTLSGEWSSALTNVVSVTDGSQYPISTVKLSKSDITSSAIISGGTGINFWTIDKDNWWAVVSYNSSSSSSYSCNPYSCGSYPCSYTVYDQVPYNCNCRYDQIVTGYNCCPSGYHPPNCAQLRMYCHSGNCTNGYPASVADFIPCLTNTYVCDTCYNQVPRTVNTTCSSTCYQTCTSTSYSYVLRLLNSVDGVVSTIGTDIALGSEAVAIEISTSGNNITAKAYSDTNKTSQLGTTLSYSASSPTKGFNVGIIKTPSNYNQGSTVANFVASVN